MPFTAEAPATPAPTITYLYLATMPLRHWLHRNRALELLTDHAAGTANQLPRRVQFVRDVAQEDAAHPVVRQIVDDAFVVRLLPVGDRLERRIDVADRLVSEVEQVGEEVGHARVHLVVARHVLPGDQALVDRIIPVLDAAA